MDHHSRTGGTQQRLEELEVYSVACGCQHLGLWEESQAPPDIVAAREITFLPGFPFGAPDKRKPSSPPVFLLIQKALPVDKR